MKYCNFIRVQRRHICSPAASFAYCVMTLYLLKVHLQTFLSFHTNNSKMPNDPPSHLVPKVLEKSRAIPLLTLRVCVAYKKGENLTTLLSQMSDMLRMIYSPHVYHFIPCAGKTEPTFIGLIWGGGSFFFLAQENERHFARQPFLMTVVQCKELFSIIPSDYLKPLFFFCQKFPWS